MVTYTLEQVKHLLKKQRENCLSSARIEEHEYNNPYSSSDGKIERRINRNSILNAKNPLDEDINFSL